MNNSITCSQIVSILQILISAVSVCPGVQTNKIWVLYSGYERFFLTDQTEVYIISLLHTVDGIAKVQCKLVYGLLSVIILIIASHMHKYNFTYKIY